MGHKYKKIIRVLGTIILVVAISIIYQKAVYFNMQHLYDADSIAVYQNEQCIMVLDKARLQEMLHPDRAIVTIYQSFTPNRNKKVIALRKDIPPLFELVFFKGEKVIERIQICEVDVDYSQWLGRLWKGKRVMMHVEGKKPFLIESILNELEGILAAYTVDP